MSAKKQSHMKKPVKKKKPLVQKPLVLTDEQLDHIRDILRWEKSSNEWGRTSTKELLERSQENGPWSVVIEKDNQGLSHARVDSDDASLWIRGDFASVAERNRYAKMIARRLNKATKLEKGKV